MAKTNKKPVQPKTQQLVNSQVAENEFARLMQQDTNGLLRPEAVVETASNPNHPWHDRFTWDDTAAAEKYRLQEAVTLIRSYNVTISPLKMTVRALTSLDMDRNNGGGYRWTMETLARPDMREATLRTALAELERVRVRYAHLEELVSVWETLGEVQLQG